jgi:hypothetical protein
LDCGDRAEEGVKIWNEGCLKKQWLGADSTGDGKLL